MVEIQVASTNPFGIFRFAAIHIAALDCGFYRPSIGIKSRIIIIDDFPDFGLSGIGVTAESDTAFDESEIIGEELEKI
jgi:hypothetical protein